VQLLIVICGASAGIHAVLTPVHFHEGLVLGAVIVAPRRESQRYRFWVNTANRWTRSAP
jgi:hypothetical protein